MRIEDSIARYNLLSKTDQKTQKLTGQEEVNGQNQQPFESILKQKMQTAELTFSKHAEQRLAQREIELNDQDIQRLNSAALKAGEKGVKNTLVLMDRAAFIINIPNNTVITAMDNSDLKENVFTQIDGTVII